MPPSPSLHRMSWCPAPPPRSARRTYPRVCNASSDLASVGHAADSEQGVDGDLPQAGGCLRVEGVSGNAERGGWVRVDDRGFVAVLEVATADPLHEGGARAQPGRGR